MSTSDVVRLDEYRGRRQERLERGLALYGADPERARLAALLWQTIELTGGDRAAAVWVDEYGPGLVHVHCVLDLASDEPRRSFSLEILRRAWEDGVPGLLDLPEPGAGEQILPGGSRSLAAVALGSDGVRAWFLVVDSRTPRPPLSGEVSDTFMFLAGECSSCLLHRDLEVPSGEPREGAGGEDFERLRQERFTGWPVLRDVEGKTEDGETSRRITARFLVTRLLRGVLDDDLTVDPDSLQHQIEGVRRELDDAPVGGDEPRAWVRVLDALEAGDLRELTGAVLELGDRVEWQGHLFGARELHRIAFDLAVARGDVESAADAARVLGRACRKMADWSAAGEWYESGREIARSGGLRRAEALIVDGLGNLRRERGNLPAARELYEEALAIGRSLDDRRVLGSAHQNLLIVEKHEGRTDEAIRHGWAAVQAYDTDERMLGALTDLGDVFIRCGALDAAEDAFSVVARRTGKLDVRVLGLDALSHIAALRNDGDAFRKRVERVEREPWSDVSVGMRAQVLLFRGRSHRALGQVDEAVATLEAALALAEEHEVNKVLFEAEGLLRELREGRSEESSWTETDDLPPAKPETIVEVGEPLARMARAPAEAAL